MEYFSDPVPHIVLDPFIDPKLYRAARFPDLAPKRGGRIGRDLYTGEADYETVLERAGWGPVRQELTSEAFTVEVLRTFASDLAEYGCAVHPEKAYLEPYNESRQETETATLSETHPPEALFNRFDFQATDATYAKGVHLDWPRRLVGGVLFCCSADEEGMEGGHLAFYVDDDFKNDRHCHKPRLAKEYSPRHNFGVLFLNCNIGFHGPTKITKIDGLRKWIYFSISSRRDVWPFAPNPRFQR